MSQDKNLKTKKRIGNILTLIAITILLFSLYRKGQGANQSILTILGYGACFMALLYSYWMRKGSNQNQ